MQMPDLKLTNINGVELELYDTGGDGEPVVFIHGGSTDECYAVIQEPALTERFRVIHYMRRGWGKSTTDGLPLSIPQQAEDCRAVMRHLGVEKAHLEGLSYGGTILLQFAVDFPEVVHTLALLEPGLPEELESPELIAGLEESEKLYATGDKAGALDAAFKEICGPDYRAAFDKNLPAGWFDRWVADLETLFEHDMGALESWTFTEEDARRITQPVLNMSGEHTRPYLRANYDSLKAWMPQAESVILPDSTHAMLEEQPKASAETLADFFARHPMKD